ncbi:MAG: hypothetical protein AAB152_05240 [Candidatus Coatesbacteria bacterium]
MADLPGAASVNPSLAVRRRLALGWTVLVLAGFLTKAWPGWRETASSWLADLGRGEAWRAAAILPVLPGHLASAGGLVALLAGWLAAGLPCARWLAPRVIGGDRLVLALVLGAGTTSLLVQGAGLAGLLFVPFLLAGAVAFAAAGLRAAIRGRAWEVFRPEGPDAQLPAALCGVAVAAGWLLSRLPDFYEDTAVQHFAIPEQCAAVHRLFSEASNTLWHLSLGGEMLYLPLWVLGGITAAKLANVAVAAILLLVTRRLAGALGADRAASWWAAVGLGSVAFLPGSCWAGKNDLVAVLFFVASVWGVASARDGGAAWWGVAGWCLGLAGGVKYTVAYLVPGLLAAAWWPGGVKPARRAFVPVAGLAVLPVAGWFVRNWLTIGNPFHPVLSGVFPEPFWSPFHAHAMAAGRHAFSSAEVKSAWYPLFAPWDVALDPQFGSPLIAIVLPGALILSPGPAAWRVLLGVGYGCWACSERFGRYLAPLLPIVAAAGAPAVLRLAVGRSAAWARGFAAGLVVWTVVASAAARLAPSGWRVVLGQTTPAAYLRARYTTWDDARRWAAARTTLRERLLLTGDERRLWFGGRVLTSGGVAEPMWRLTLESASPADLRRRLRELGLRFLLHNHVQAAYRSLTWIASPEWSPRQLVVYRDFMRRYARPVYFQSRVDFANGGFAGWIFETLPGFPGFAVSCLPQAEGRFRGTLERIAAGRAEEALGEARRVGVPGGAVLVEDEILGYCEMAVGRVDRARRVFREGLDTGFAMRGAYSGYASCLAAAGDLDGAIRWKAREWLYLELDETLGELARLLSARAQERHLPQGRWGPAARDLGRVATLRPGDWRSLGLAAAALERLGRRGEACWYARRALALAPGAPGLAELAGRLEGTITK